MGTRWIVCALVALAVGCSSDKHQKPAPTGTGGGGGDGGSGGAASGGPGSGGDAGSGTGGSAASNSSGGGSSSGGSSSGGSSPGGSSSGGAGSGGSAGAAGSAGAPGRGPISIASGLDAPAGIAVNRDYVYFAERDAARIARCPLSGCDGTPEVVASNQQGAIAVGLDDSDLYWVTGWASGDSGNPSSREVYSCPIDDCNEDSIQSFDTGTVNPWGLVVSADAVILAAWPTVLSCPKTGCFDQGEVVGTGSVIALDVDDEFMYLSYAGWRQVGRCPLGGCEDTGVFLNEIHSLGIAVDETYVYVADYDFFNIATPSAPRIVRCELGGCDDDPEEVVSDVIGPWGVAVDDERLYYSDLEAGTITSIPKP